MSSSCFQLTLSEARSAFASILSPLPSESIQIHRALDRVLSSPFVASQPKPSFSQSTRDGFALSVEPLTVKGATAVFEVIKEVAAGCTNAGIAGPGQAVRIMTGAMLPDGCSRVVPFEICRDIGHVVEVPVSELKRTRSFIRHKGAEVQAGSLLLDAGLSLQPDHLLVLAENNCQKIDVYRQPRVAVLCTGSELVAAGERSCPGQKVSGNGILLSSLLSCSGACCRDILTVGDRADDILQSIDQLLGQGVDMIITTGGMGPGKYDLMQQVFSYLKGDLVYNSLHLRPGKSTLFGTVDNIPLFALPGPPPAVRLLFHELVTPALCHLQGRAFRDPLVTAYLAEPLQLKQTGYLSLKGAVVNCSHGKIIVRVAGQMEPIHAIMHLGDNGKALRSGERIKVHLVGPLQGLAG